MKILGYFGGIVVSLFIVIYAVVFTSVGNGILKPIIENKINEQTKLKSELNLFSLSINDFEILLNLDDKNSIHIKGNYSLFSQSFNVAYRVSLNKLENLKSLTNAPVQGVLKTQGSVKGDLDFLQVDGKSDVAKSETSYHIELTKLNPTSIIAKIKDASLSSLLYMGSQKQYANANINLDINFKNIVAHNLDGDIKLITNNGKINTKVIKKDFNLTLPKTDFSMNLDAKLSGDDIDYKYFLHSNLAKITTAGKITPEPLQTNITYGLDVKELALFKVITGADIRGSVSLNGHIKGDKKKLLVDGKTNLASSSTNFEAILKDFAPASIQADVKNLKLQKLLYMVKQPHYTDGLFDLNINISDAREQTLKGTIVSKIKNGLLDSKYLTKAYEFNSTMPTTTFHSTTKTIINKNIIDTSLVFNSSLANVDINRARFNLKDKSLVSDYKAVVANLDKLFFITQRDLKGGISANGELKKDKDLELTLNSKIAGGDIKAKVFNDKLTANLKSIQTLDILHILIYPELFKSSLDGKLTYNMSDKKGKFNGNLKNGKFTKNQVLTSIKKYAKVDMYVETFKGVVGADINKEHILASLDLSSNTSAIKTKNTKLNTLSKKIDSKITVVANKTPISVKLKGDIKSPKVEVDLKEFMKSKVGKEIKNRAIKEVDKIIKSKDVTNLLKGLF